jgi:hypothetical protein
LDRGRSQWAIEILGEFSLVEGLATEVLATEVLATEDGPALGGLRQQRGIQVDAYVKVTEFYTMLFSELPAQTNSQNEMAMGTEGLSVLMVSAQLGGMWPLASLLASVELRSDEDDSMNQARFGSFFVPPVHSFLSAGEMPYCTHRRARIGEAGTGYEKGFVGMLV